MNKQYLPIHFMLLGTLMMSVLSFQNCSKTASSGESSQGGVEIIQSTWKVQRNKNVDVNIKIIGAGYNVLVCNEFHVSNDDPASTIPTDKEDCDDESAYVVLNEAATANCGDPGCWNYDEETDTWETTLSFPGAAAIYRKGDYYHHVIDEYNYEMYKSQKFTVSGPPPTL